MAPLSIQTYVVGSVQTNCYFAINDDTKEVLIRTRYKQKPNNTNRTKNKNSYLS